jgi:LysR family transcriptional regulator for metE and metH
MNKIKSLLHCVEFCSTMWMDLFRYCPLELRHFRLVWAVAEKSNLTGAARQLNLTTSALSHQLRQLENIAGTPAFYRDGKFMRLTRAGEMLRDAAERILEIVHETDERLSGNAVAPEDVIRLCAQCYTGYHWLPAVVRAFEKSHHCVGVRIVPEATRQPFAALRERRLDLVISFDPPAERSFATEFLFRDELLLIVNRNHRLARRSYVVLRELAEEHLIMYADSIRDSHFVQRHLAPANIRPKRFTSVALTEGILEMVRAGLGVTVLARWAAESAVGKDLVAKRLTRRGLKRNWYAVTQRKPARKSALATLIGTVRSNMNGRIKPAIYPRRFAARAT